LGADPDKPELHLKPTEMLPVVYVAKDDYGIASADLLVGIDGGEMKPTKIGTPERE